MKNKQRPKNERLGLNRLMTLVFLLIIFVSHSIAQDRSRRVEGVVSDTKEPLIGVTVNVKGTTIGTITDIDGRYTIEVKKDNDTLVFSYLGYEPKEIIVGTQTIINVSLSESNKLLDEVVVVGYGTQKKSSMTAAITTLNPNEITNVPRPNIYSALQGRIAGLTVTEATGDPNSSPTLLLRGKGTIDGDTSPLILVDGVPTANLNQIPANDIEAISVLKDGAAAAIYGARAANGVILVTTKQGRSGDTKPVVQLNSYIGLQTLAQFPDRLNSYQYASMINEIARNEAVGSNKGNKYPIFSIHDMEMFRHGVTDDLHANTNWKKEGIRDIAPIYTNHVSVSGNSQLGRYYVSGEYMQQDGMVKEIDKRNRINLRANIVSDITNRIQFQFNTNYIRTNQISGGLADIFNVVLTTSPTIPVRYKDGHWGNTIFANGAHLSDASNVVQNITEYGPRDLYWHTFNTSGGLSYRPINDLTVKVQGTYQHSQSDSQEYNRSWIAWNPLTQSVGQSGPANLSERWTKEYKYDFQTTVNYEKTINKNYIKVLAGFSTESFRSDYIQGYRKNFINESLQELNAGDASTQTNAGGADQWAFASFFGRLNYAYDDRYLFEANFRHDGSSRFAPSKQWGTFPSLSLGWNINKENFMKDITFIDKLKPRVSWGQLGNAEKVGLYLWFGGIDSGPYYNFDGNQVFGTRPSDPENRELVWETTTFYNAGLDGSFLNGKYTFEVDFWKKNTDDIILTIPISTVIGSSSSSQTVNAGKVASHGFDISVGTRGNLTKDFTYDARLSFTAWNSWVVDLKNRASAFSTEYRPGDDFGNYYGYECLGIINDEATLSAYKKIENVSPYVDLGDLQYKDQNGDGRIDYMDVVKIGNWNTKKNFGLNLNLGYRAFDFQIFFQGAFDVDKMMDGATRSTGTYGSSDTNKFDRWTEENRNADALYPRLRRQYTHNTDVLSSFWIKNASYVKLKNLQIGYNLPKPVLSKIGIQNLRFYVSGTNLFTIAPDFLKGYDPEGDMRTDIYPTLRVYSFGLNLQF
ncbi:MULTISPECIES: SusC/RagA family TonB-linked outer membrane protein [Dysgonomonas]|uniref:SusC/RagA family TonB-linked outer membrane protein n=1 Tax=Dysgonomonas TaxID=156973 RepID=UPI0009259A27|nr:MULTISPECIES: TonB-dependent receptor [Dysgonomonas]MBN9300218.1 TonB-dependent receptor [Dysgonomonas mossii]OJX59470.1 MAG: hypothetical protein BGO84_12010 [Dysgonomonas sp. 37-18]